ncbi:phosphoserine phosphatase SerB [Sphingomonas jatrophae]|uniref:Phosphoserine phosphatase n=1 Tax=Sphingomonas jatrophae TaxID=1166337 RepID=A0A1I6JJ77_9SPHN|nr:phosphoserine phosphatase SerB [Sphingomonas jatrophae]SFR78971.1 phosphoserine phosphatase [Sphingomonas jatrophae]
MFIATLVAADRLSSDDLQEAQAALALAGCAPVDAAWLDEGQAADLFFNLDPAGARAALADAGQRVDVIVQPAAHRRKRLLVADMDSTMIEIECIDELADYAGIKPQVAEVTERAMRGELDFEAALDARVALLKGMEASVLDRCHAERVRIMAGARPLIRTMRANGARCVLVSGGFTHFADRVAAEIGFDRALSNVLELGDGRLTGTVSRPIVGAQTKRETLLAEAAALGLSAQETMAVGDGANDVPMIEVAGLGVAYHGKEKVRAAADACVVHGDLSVLLYAQGYKCAEWAD